MEKVRLLLADHDRPIADLVATAARYKGWEAVTAYAGEEALRSAAEFHPDVMALDLILPGLDGFGVLDRLRGSGTMVSVVFLTALRRAGRPGRGTDPGRGRVSGQVVRGGGADGPAADSAAAQRGGPGFRRSVLRVADLRLDEDTRRCGAATGRSRSRRPSSRRCAI